MNHNPINAKVMSRIVVKYSPTPASLFNSALTNTFEAIRIKVKKKTQKIISRYTGAM